MLFSFCCFSFELFATLQQPTADLKPENPKPKHVGVAAAHLQPHLKEALGWNPRMAGLVARLWASAEGCGGQKRLQTPKTSNCVPTLSRRPDAQTTEQ